MRKIYSKELKIGDKFKVGHNDIKSVTYTVIDGERFKQDWGIKNAIIILNSNNQLEYLIFNVAVTIVNEKEYCIDYSTDGKNWFCTKVCEDIDLAVKFYEEQNIICGKKYFYRITQNYEQVFPFT